MSTPDTAVADDTTTRVRYGPLSIAVAVLFGLFYVYDLFGAVSNVASLPAQIELGNKLLRSLDQPTLAVPWALLVADLLVAPVAFGLAFWFGRRGTVAVRALYFAIGLTVAAAVTLTIEFLAAAS